MQVQHHLFIPAKPFNSAKFHITLPCNTKWKNIGRFSGVGINCSSQQKLLEVLGKELNANIFWNSAQFTVWHFFPFPITAFNPHNKWTQLSPSFPFLIEMEWDTVICASNDMTFFWNQSCHRHLIVLSSHKTHPTISKLLHFSYCWHFYDTAGLKCVTSEHNTPKRIADQYSNFKDQTTSKMRPNMKNYPNEDQMKKQYPN